MPETTSYSSRFQDQSAVESYEHTEYVADSYASNVWQWQRPVVEQIIRGSANEGGAGLKLLDFACGTGRVIACMESLVATADGIDISENMVAKARAKCSKARFKVGNILANPGLLEGPYDVITAFRFLLNVEPGLRLEVLRKLREVIRPGGLLLINVHGNSRSLRHPAILWRRWCERSKPSGAMLNEMSPGETKALLQSTFR
jgi:SAM-dependent methyltransferase